MGTNPPQQPPGYPPQRPPGYTPQPPYGQQPYGQSPFGQPGGYPQPARTNGLAIAGFVLSFFISLVGLILSIIALNQINRSNGTQKGKGLAIAGIVISALSMLATFAALTAR